MQPLPSNRPPDGDSVPQPMAGASTDLLLEKPVGFFLVLLVLVLGAVALERSLRPWRAYYSEPGVGAQWIWAADVADAGMPVAFWLVRDLELPAAAVPGARLAIAADEGYELWINGRRLGSRQLPSGRARIESDLYDVSGFLEAGVNRILVKVRSSRGAGGLLASLRDVDGMPLLVSDEDWRVVRRFDRALMQGRRTLDDPGDVSLDRPVVWGHPPTGRWRVRAAQSLRRLPAARPASPPPLLPHRLRYLSANSRWTEVNPSRPLPPAGTQTLFDFGHAVTGFLALDLHRTPDERRDGSPALVFLGTDRPPRPGLEDLRPDVVAIPMPGGFAWRDLHPRTFRFVAVVGAPPASTLYAVTASGVEASAWAPPQSDHRGVFGLRPSTRYSPVEELVWNRLGGIQRPGAEPEREAATDEASADR